VFLDVGPLAGEGMLEQQQLARGVDALPARGVPRVADLDAIDGGDDVVERVLTPRAAPTGRRALRG
jgi:hypothetical protein